MGTTTAEQKGEISTQTAKIFRDDMDEDDEYYDEDDPDRAFKKDMSDMEVTGLDKFLARVTPKLFQILEANAKSHTFDTYDVAWEDEVEETVMIHKLDTDYDFTEANNATQKTL